MKPTLCAIALCLSCAACSTSARITLNDGSTIDGEIIDSDAHRIHINSDDYGPGSIAREHIADIDHPGTAAAVVGSVVTGIGLMVMTAGIATTAGCSGDFCGFGHVFMTIPGAGTAAIGLPPMIWGFSTWGGSKSAASSDDPGFRYDPYAPSSPPHASTPPGGFGFSF